jgi:hypothetical protein
MGAYDSAGQQYDDPAITFALCSPEQLDAGLCGPEWHSHLVKPVSDSVCAIAKVGALTFEEPSATVVANQDNIKVVNVKKGIKSFTESVTNTPTDFTAGNSAVNPNPVTGDGVGVPFDLTPVFDDGSLQAICIGPVNETGLLCRDLGDGTIPSTTAYILETSTGGNWRIELSEFPYSEDIWNAANTYQVNALEASVVGPYELRNWYNANCVVEE